MHDVRSTRWHRLGGLAVLAILAHGSASRAQEAGDDAKEEPATASKPAGAIRADGAEEAKVRAHWTARLAAVIERIDRSCRLTAVQRKKLELAGRGDIKRCFDGAHDEQTAPAEQGALQKQIEEGVFGPGSMFAKTLPRALDRDQLEKYRAERRERRRRIHRARVDVVVALFDELAGCTDEQRERLARLFMERTQLSTAPNDQVALVLAQAAALPESQLRPIFDDSQWRTVSRALKAVDRELKDLLRRAVLEPDDPADSLAVHAVEPVANK